MWENIYIMNNSISKFWSGGFLYNPESNSVFLHLRDGNTKFNPNAWAFFGGLNEGSENDKECFIRELKEEIGLSVDSKDVIKLDEYMNVELNTYRHVFYVTSSLINKNDLMLGEGEGFDWVSLNDIERLHLTEKTKRDLIKFINKINNNNV